ncbi:MAG: hypothetical protein AABP62_10380 [Planctomycetota bacterium]
MKLAKNGKSVTLELSEFETMVRHMQQFEKIVNQFEKQEAAKTLPKEWDTTWTKLKKFLDTEDAQSRAEATAKKGPTTRAAGVYCCRLHSNLGTLKCQTFRTRYVFAIAGCVAQAILAHCNATVVSGDCSTNPLCQQLNP